MNYRTHTSAGRRAWSAFGLLGRRSAAYLLDMLILFGILAPAGQLMLWLLDTAPPQTGPAIARVILWNFSLPAWIYFILGDQSASGATLGKRLFKIRVTDTTHKRLTVGRALGRTTIKLLPWELVHIFAFALSTDLSRFSRAQLIGVAAANLLTLVYLGVAVATRGRRSVHDYAAGTLVRPVAVDTKGNSI
jgi:uncharacterized RDD family membrane protein YckC